MSKDTRQKVDANSAEFKQGIEAGLDSDGGAKKREAGNELGRALKDTDEEKAPVDESLRQGHPVPLFMRDTSDGHKGNAQDEKDGTEE